MQIRNPQIAVAVTPQNDYRQSCSIPGSGTFSAYVMWTVTSMLSCSPGVTLNVAFDYKRVAIPELPEKQAALGFFWKIHDF
ncbi:hypothetical protein KCP69_21575 [Salmonella enterica subsp. enterica]|nr:hypothetical protein KCP69_21575 [Salmonella enterica subsp. enterica]